jgi:hypothetical protein
MINGQLQSIADCQLSFSEAPSAQHFLKKNRRESATLNDI